jgi:hypothetical protein
MANVTGWSELINGSLVKAPYIMFNAAFNGNFLVVPYVVLSATLFVKTKSVVLPFILGIIMYIRFQSYLSPLSNYIMFTTLLFELAGILWEIFWK